MKVCSQIHEGNTPPSERLHPFYEQEEHASEIGLSHHRLSFPSPHRGRTWERRDRVVTARYKDQDGTEKRVRRHHAA